MENDGDTRVFYARWSPFFLPVYLPIGALGFLAQWADGEPGPFGLSWWEAHVVLLLLFPLYLSAMVHRFPVRLSPQRLAGHNLWGAPTSILWSSITSAEYRRVLGIPYVRVSGGTHDSPIWVPLKLRDRAGFEVALRELSPNNHLLQAAEAAA